MKAIILAAGRGSRMGQITAEQPKCLTPLGGRPLLDWQRTALQAAGIAEVGVVSGYRRETLPSALHAFVNERWSETNMVVSLCCAAAWLRSEPCIVSYSDIVFAPQTIQTLMQAKGEIAISYNTEWLSLWQSRLEDPLSDAETFAVDATGRITDIGRRPKSLDEVQGQYMGLLKFEPSGWAKVEAYLNTLAPDQVDRLDMTSLLQRLIASGIAISGVPVAGMWYEVDTGSDLALCERELQAEGDRHWLRATLPG